MKRQNLLIGISGLVCSGKTTFANLLAKKIGAEIISFRNFFIKKLKKQKKMITRANLDKYSNEYLQTRGINELIKNVLSQRKNNNTLILDGVRMTETVKYIEKLKEWQYIGIYVDTNYKTRLARLKQRQENDLLSEELHQYDKKLLSRGLNEIKKISKWKIDNNGDMQSIVTQTKQLISQIQ